MRNYIDIVNEAQLDEAGSRLGHIAAAAALAGTAGYHVGTSQQAPLDEPTPQIYLTTDDLNLGSVHADDEVEQDSPKNAPQSKKDEAIKLLALTMWGEARSDGPQAMRAVGHVVMNRLKSERNFGDNIKQVVWKRKHFSCWNAGDPNRESMKRIASLPDSHPSKQRWYQAVKIAKAIINGQDRVDPTKGALFYHTKQMGQPYWVSDDMKPIAKISNHYFYRTDAKAKT